MLSKDILIIGTRHFGKPGGPPLSLFDSIEGDRLLGAHAGLDATPSRKPQDLRFCPATLEALKEAALHLIKINKGNTKLRARIQCSDFERQICMGNSMSYMQVSPFLMLYI